MSFDELEKIEKLAEELVKNRLIPTNYCFEDSNDFWLDFRSLINQPMSGGELYSEWIRLWEAIPEKQHHETFQHIQESWGFPCETFEDVRQAFLFQVIRANVMAVRDAGFELMLPPLGEDGAKALENRWEVTIPTFISQFLQDVSAGFASEDYVEEIYFPFDSSCQKWNIWGQSYEDDFYVLSIFDDEPEVVSSIEKRIGYALEQFLLYPEASCIEFDEFDFEDPVSSSKQYSVSQDTLDTVCSMVWLHVYFEGNHLDYGTLLVTKGKLAGKVVRCNDIVHCGVESVTLQGYWMDWFYSTYLETVFCLENPNLALCNIGLD